MPDAAFPVEMVNGVPVVLAPEEMDITNVDGLRMALLNSAAFGKATLVADLSRTRSCDTTGLHALVGAASGAAPWAPGCTAGRPRQHGLRILGAKVILDFGAHSYAR
jgi:hypothetical protein